MPPVIGRRGRPRLVLVWLHLAVLWAFAFVQPLFEILADDAAFFVARGNTRGDILILAFGLVLAPPTVLLAIEALVQRFSRRAWRAVHFFFVAALAGAFALQVLGEIAPSASGAVLMPAAAGLGASLAISYWRTRLVPGLFTALSPTPLIFLALFLLASSVSDLVLPQSEQDVQAAVHGDTPVVFVIFDELPGFHLMNRSKVIDAKRFPNFAAFARDSTWYRNATTVADATTRAVPALLTGRIPGKGKLPIASDYPKNLFTLLEDRYSLEVSESASQLCPERLCERERDPLPTRLRSLFKDLSIVSLRDLLPTDLGNRLPAVDRTFGGFGDAKIRPGHVTGKELTGPLSRGRAFERFIRKIKQTGPSRMLHFLHIGLPHVPWQFLPSGQQYPDNGWEAPGLSIADQQWTANRWLAEQGYQRHMLQLGYVDRLLGRLMSRLRRTRLYDRALVIVTADHGVSYRPSDARRSVTRTNFAEMASVALLIKSPGQDRGRIDDSLARTVDVVPTIADFIGATLPWKADGTSLRTSPKTENGTVSVTSGSGPGVSLPFVEFQRLRDADLSRSAELFGSADGIRGLYAIGPEPDLLGASVAGLTTGQRPRARVGFDGAQLFESVDPRNTVVPAFVTGRLSGVREGERLAVAVNGRVRAVTYSFRDRGEMVLTAVVPPTAFRRGSNAIDVFAIEGRGETRRLVALRASASERLRLVERGGKELILDSSGRAIPITPNAVVGFVEHLELRRGAVWARGWAVASQRGPADRVLLFVDGRFVAQGVPRDIRDDLTATHGSVTRKSGYKLAGGVATGKPSSSDVRIFGVFGEQASELDLHSNAVR